MLSRIFTQTFVRTSEQHSVLPSKILSNVRVGRMAPETTKDTIAKELQAELQEKGLAQVGKTLNQEKIILKELQEQQKESLQRIKELCVTPAQRRSAEGYNINGLFWHQKQQELKQIDTKEALQNREETIDWLKTRQDLYTVLKETHNTTPESFTENFSFNW
ncbi:hypothetical protein [Legionella sp. PC997]|uniref:hypothetical protein n=1 Tax=Legionella sp. PC997 TaxID=2755562 RepID=UPI0015FA9465|nr:hypothetical protein [Legionella sp. PC997]QMT61814.1 hypothetical protein HBNCFIEN_03220 [Legionella sp. PC997]